MAMPYLEGARDPRGFYRSLARAVNDTPRGIDKTIFEIQTVDWRTGRRIDAHEIETTLRALQSLGIRHLAYYPDDFIEGEPALAPLRRGISLATSPHEAPR
jgi:biofilm PGA synthesis lipoprotein PgaB